MDHLIQADVTAVAVEINLMDEQAYFEERVFSDYFIRGVSFKGTEHLSRVNNTLFKAELCEKDADGNHVRPEISAMFHGWKLKADATEYAKRYFLNSDPRAKIIAIESDTRIGFKSSVTIDDIRKASLVFDSVNRESDTANIIKNRYTTETGIVSLSKLLDIIQLTKTNNQHKP